jgi:hypothetical protein
LRDAAPMNGAGAAGSATFGATAAGTATATDPARHRQCLRWDDTAGCWWWADGASASFGAWSPGGAQLLHRGLPGDAAGFALCASGRLLVCQPKRLCFAAAPGAQATPGAPHIRSSRADAARAAGGCAP